MKSRFLPLVACLAAASPIWATPSGLNNIPTADVTPQGVVVLQSFTNFGNDKDADLTLGFKTGLDLFGQKFEFGADSHIVPDKGGPIVLQAKYSLPFGEGLPTLGLGVANITVTNDDRDRAGDPFSYAVLTHDFNGLFRAHVGYGVQADNNSVLLGVDKTVKLFERDLTLRSDFIQIQDESQWMGSLGFLYALHDNVVLESWASQPFDDGDTIYTVKLNFVFKF
ncbi:MAG: hypothetical protein ACAI34_15270 [Verrucomicrobium sp.]|nr:hypothetical protein [Verrucomicrobium sp.]